MARGLKFRIKVVEGLYYQYSENNGADQLRGYREADLRLCYRICKKPVFLQRGSYVNTPMQYTGIFMAVEIDNFQGKTCDNFVLKSTHDPCFEQKYGK